MTITITIDLVAGAPVMDKSSIDFQLSAAFQPAHSSSSGILIAGVDVTEVER